MMKKDVKEIKTFEDILKALRERPDWLEELRKIILTEELIALPQKFETFLQKEFRPLKEEVGGLKKDVEVLKEDVKVLKEDVEVLKKDVEVLKEDVEVLKKDVKILKDDVAELKGDSFERRVRERAPSYFGKLIKKCKVLSFEEVAEILDEALEKGIISESEREEVLHTDIIATGMHKTEKEKKIILVGEVSTTVDRNDVERAFKRSRIIARVMGISSIPIVIGKEYTDGAKEKAEEMGIILI